MPEGIDDAKAASGPLGESEFRLKLKFKPSTGPAIRVFQFYTDWLEATNTIVNEFASHVCKGLRIEIKLVEIKEGSADPKFIFEPSLIGETGKIAIPVELVQDFIPHLHEIVNADLDFLMENVDSYNFEEFFVNKLNDLDTLRNNFSALVAGTQEVAPADYIATVSLADSPAEEEIHEKQKENKEPPKYNRRKVFNALNQIAKSTSDHLMNGEVVTQLSPDGESIDVTPELVRSSGALHKDEELITETSHTFQTVVVSRAVLVGEGVWSFLWNGRSKRMQIQDREWLEKFHEGRVGLIAKQALSVDILEIEKKYLKMGIVYKRKVNYYLEKIHG